MKNINCEYYSAVRWFQWLLITQTATYLYTLLSAENYLLSSRLDWVTMGTL